MKMVKSLLLGSAAGLVAMAGAQAADLPVKAKPVEYVKVCSLYGEGFFYIPGTDTCIKIGGWVRAEYVVGGAGSHSNFISGGGGLNTTGGTPDSYFRARTVISADVRTQTEYGTLRAYYRAGFTHDTNMVVGVLYPEMAFIQFAGFTFGKTRSYFDFFAGVFSYTSYPGGGSVTGFGGQLLAAYTAQFGNGISATIAAEDATQRRNAIWDGGQNLLRAGGLPGPLQNVISGVGGCTFAPAATDTAAAGVFGAAFGGCPIGDYAAHSIPDIVASLRVDQAWGSAQIAGALHQVNGNYYGNNVANGDLAGVFTAPVGDKFGFAVMGGLVLNVPTAPGDKFWIEGTYSEGAPSYNGLANNALYSSFLRRNGGFAAAGWALDAVIGSTTNTYDAFGLPAAGTQSGIQLTKALTVGAAFEHYWTPALRTSVWGNWNSIDFNAIASSIMCNGNVLIPGGTSPYTTAVGCNPDFRVWAVGTRTIWNPVKNLDIGLEVMYAKIEQDNAPTVAYKNAGNTAGLAAVPLLARDEANWSGILRVQRNFWP